MVKDNIAIALTAEAEELLGPLLDTFMTIVWSKERPTPVCLICESADFSGKLIEAVAIGKGREGTTRIWLPHSYVALAFELSEEKKIGFVT